MEHGNEPTPVAKVHTILMNGVSDQDMTIKLSDLCNFLGIPESMRPANAETTNCWPVDFIDPSGTPIDQGLPLTLETRFSVDTDSQKE